MPECVIYGGGGCWNYVIYGGGCRLVQNVFGDQYDNEYKNCTYLHPWTNHPTSGNVVEVEFTPAFTAVPTN